MTDPADVSVTQHVIQGGQAALPVRVYRAAAPAPHLPVMIYFHGGGFVHRYAPESDGFCRALATACACIVVAVDYRLAPGHPFPAAPEDCFRATQWIAQTARELGGDPGRLILWGDSAGGALATVVTLMARDRDGPKISGQILLYPFVAGLREFPSRVPFIGTEMFDDILATWRQYVPKNPEAPPPLAAPLLVEDLRMLPPAVVITAEMDPLRDEGEAYVARLRAAGNAVKSFRINGVAHGFMTFVKDPDLKFVRDQTLNLIIDRLAADGLLARPLR